MPFKIPDSIIGGKSGALIIAVIVDGSTVWYDTGMFQSDFLTDNVDSLKEGREPLCFQWLPLRVAVKADKLFAKPQEKGSTPQARSSLALACGLEGFKIMTARSLPTMFIFSLSLLCAGAGREVHAQEKKEPSAEVIALCDAASRGKTAEVLALIKKGTPVNAHGPTYGKTPLVLAILHRHPETVKALLENGADVHFADGSQRYPIYFCHISTVEIMTLILAKGGDREVDFYAGATAKAPNGIGKTCLGSVCAYGQGDPAMIPLLVKAGANPNKKYIYLKSTPLILAIEKERKGFDNAVYVKALIENGADVNLKNDKGVTPLQAACKKGDSRVIELLQKAGAKE